MRAPELKSLSRDRGLRNYSRLRKAELVAFLTIWVRIISAVRGEGPPINLRDTSICCGEYNIANSNILLILGNR